MFGQERAMISNGFGKQLHEAWGAAARDGGIGHVGHTRMDTKTHFHLDTSVLMRLLVGAPLNQFRAAASFLEESFADGKVIAVADLVLAGGLLCLAIRLRHSQGRRHRLARSILSGSQD